MGCIVPQQKSVSSGPADFFVVVHCNIFLTSSTVMTILSEAAGTTVIRISLDLTGLSRDSNLAKKVLSLLAEASSLSVTMDLDADEIPVIDLIDFTFFELLVL